MGNNNYICSILYEKYYESKNFSVQTSSFWREYGAFQKVKKTKNGFKLKGLMFGDYRKRSLINSIRNLPTNIYLSKLLKDCNQEIVNSINFIAKKTLRTPSYDLARMALTLNFLYENLPDISDKKFCIIGDGYGVLGCLIKKFFPKANIISINLGRTLFFDVYYSQMVFPNLEHKLLKEDDQLASKDFTFIEAEKLKKIEADIFINIASMQEMNPEDIDLYFDKIRSQNSDTWFYCCNRISKVLPDGTNIIFDKFPWSKKDKVLVEELCPWQKEYPANRPPFIFKFPDPIKHKLIKVNLKKK